MFVFIWFISGFPRKISKKVYKYQTWFSWDIFDLQTFLLVCLFVCLFICLRSRWTEWYFEWRPAAILANSELDLGREELHHHLPLPHGPLQVGTVIIICCSVEDHLSTSPSHHQLEFIKFSRIKIAYSVAAMLSIFYIYIYS